MVRLAIALLLLMLQPSRADAQQRIALLIGNEGYASAIGRLSNPHNDIALLEKSLKGLGFEVVTVSDAGLGALTRAVNAYARRLQSAGSDAVGFFYYSGHGASDGTTNYLIPVDVKTIETGELWDQSLRLTEITRKLKAEAGNATHFIVFDACRNTLKLTQPGSRAVVQSKGFIPIAQENGMLVAYATAEGELASDVGLGAGPYAKVLAEEIVKPGVEAVVMFRIVQRRVRTAIGQEPYLGFNALGDIYLAGQAPAAAGPGVTDAAREWSQVDKTSIAELETFVRRHASSSEADYARARIDGLKQAAAAGSPKQAAQPIAPPKHDAGSLGQSIACVNARDQDGCERAGCTWFLRSCMTPANALAVKLAMEKTPPSPTRCDGVEAQVGTERRCLKAKDSFRDCSNCPEMVLVPAGEFLMGSNDGDAHENEKPVHKVTVVKPFAVGTFEVTVSEYLACSAAKACRPPEWNEPGSKFNASTGSDDHYKKLGSALSEARHPIVGISWNDAKAYVAWITKRTRKPYRLLSEAEWEYAARGGSSAKYAWGDEIGKNRANCDGCGSQWDNKQTAPVGSFQANGFGLHDMHGNVWEWVADCEAKYTVAPSDGTTAPEITNCSRVVRGGAWSNYPGYQRAAVRSGSGSTARNNYVGFRVARTLEP